MHDSKIESGRMGLPVSIRPFGACKEPPKTLTTDLPAPCRAREADAHEIAGAAMRVGMMFAMLLIGLPPS